jgi:hypothetical protein
MNKSKALKVAKAWLNPALMYAIHDCSDSMHESEKLEERFNALMDDSIAIEEFVKVNLYKEYIRECIEVARFEGAEFSEVEGVLQGNPNALPIPWIVIQNDIKDAVDVPF